MPERIRRRNLPHWDVPGAAYFITSCLHGSIPSQGLLDLAQHRAALENRPCPEGISASDWKVTKDKLQFARFDKWLDDKPAVRWFNGEAVAKVAVDAFLHRANDHYDLFAFVVMPSHIHWVFQPREQWTQTLDETRPARERIVHSLNTHVGREGNRLLERTGPFWQHEGYDHWIRDVDELERIIQYIENNPVKAGLARSPDEWKYSSACFRKTHSIPFGTPLRRRT